jgi:hypothetical protein
MRLGKLRFSPVGLGVGWVWLSEGMVGSSKVGWSEVRCVVLVAWHPEVLVVCGRV